MPPRFPSPLGSPTDSIRSGGTSSTHRRGTEFSAVAPFVVAKPRAVTKLRGAFKMYFPYARRGAGAFLNISAKFWRNSRPACRAVGYGYRTGQALHFEAVRRARGGRGQGARRRRREGDDRRGPRGQDLRARDEARSARPARGIERPSVNGSRRPIRWIFGRRVAAAARLGTWIFRGRVAVDTRWTDRGDAAAAT